MWVLRLSEIAVKKNAPIMFILVNINKIFSKKNDRSIGNILNVLKPAYLSKDAIIEYALLNSSAISHEVILIILSTLSGSKNIPSKSC